MSEWISVEDGLPEPGLRVEIKTVNLGTFYLSKDGVSWIRDYKPDHGWHVTAPTHWRLEPDPPTPT